MSSVTQRIKEIKQPRGGYVQWNDFNNINYNDGIEMKTDTRILPAMLGLVVDYLTRFMLTKNILESFNISIIGHEIYENQNLNEYSLLPNYDFNKLLNTVKGLDFESIESAFILSHYDIYFRTNSSIYMKYKKSKEDLKITKDDAHNVKVLVERNLKFIKDYSPFIHIGLNFPKESFTNIINSGDGDLVSKDYLWDIKTSKKIKRSPQDILQIIVYYLMGLKGNVKGFDQLKGIGFFNPMMNTVSTIQIKDIDSDVIDFISKFVIGYEN